MNSIFETNLPGLTHRGKVRDTYELNDNLLLMIVTDRISAFDVVLPDPIPGKGKILASMSKFWFNATKHIIPNHFIGLASEPETFDLIKENKISSLLDDEIKARTMVVKKAKRIDIECIVRGYITGSAWSEYKKTQQINKINIEPGLLEAQKFPKFLFTPSTKAEIGHDEPLSPQETYDLIGEELTNKLEQISIDIFTFAHQYSLSKGIILADTKMEFGFLNDQLILIDELLTPDSSRFWSSNDYKLGKSPEPFDKQHLRNWLIKQDWDKNPPAPNLPEKIINQTIEKYSESFQILTTK
ncbi:MAG: phosphoribosylaminoimidazolesuccinocarboxamide synthase [Chloroflexi bacterium]|nr:phosphoribosylaminoimidazolesuccinocarboxamide synthase [Chloroflexota bacterium]|tara:strand:- start:11203 stop:12099 length:897 start_codon:yes stop_codon:yes gene_type:complete